jgi:hypothetical protein
VIIRPGDLPGDVASSAFLTEFELGCALELRRLRSRPGRRHDQPVQRDENEREIAKLTDELAHTDT